MRIDEWRKVFSKPGYDPAIVKKKTSLRIRENIFIAAELLWQMLRFYFGNNPAFKTFNYSTHMIFTVHSLTLSLTLSHLTSPILSSSLSLPHYLFVCYSLIHFLTLNLSELDAKNLNMKMTAKTGLNNFSVTPFSLQNIFWQVNYLAILGHMTKLARFASCFSSLLI